MTTDPLLPDRPRILIVDDEEALRKFLCMGLEMAGFTCGAAENGAAALEYLARNPVDVVVTDVIMPGMDGLKLCEAIRLDHTADVVVMTGFSEYSYEQILQRGASDFMQKPIRIAELVTRLHRVLALRAAYRDRDLALTQTREMLEKYRQAVDGAVQAISMTVEIKDPYTSGHQKRVAEIAVAAAGRLGLSDDRVYGLRIAALIHDLGKITVPSEILCKTGEIAGVEYELMKRHVDVGYSILRNIDFPWPVADIVWQHHERMDGSGYPRGLKGDEIMMEARILAVADVFETMTSHRPYRPSKGNPAAVEELRDGRGTRYDAAVTDAVLDLYREENCA